MRGNLVARNEGYKLTCCVHRILGPEVEEEEAKSEAQCRVCVQVGRLGGSQESQLGPVWALRGGARP